MFNRNKNLQLDLTKISKDLYQRNIELAETNKTLSLLQAIDTFALESNESLASLCQNIAKVITKTTDYACVVVFTRSPGSEDLTLQGWSLQNSPDAAFPFKNVPAIKLNNPWFERPELSQLVALDTLPIPQVTALLGCSEEELQAFHRSVPLQSIYLMKLVSRKQLSGIIAVGFVNPASQLTDSDMQLLNRLRESAGIAIENKLLFEENQHVLQQLSHENEIIEHTVQERTEQLRAAQEQLKATDKLKTEFIMLTSHNLRTPLAILRGNIEVLEVSGMSKEQMESVAHLRSSVERLRQFIDELLAISSIEAGDQLAINDVAVKDLLDPLIEETRKQSEAKGIGFEVSNTAENTKVKVNTSLVREAFRNILDNAVKFTHQGNVSLATAVQDGMLAVTIRDSGIGIAPEEIDKLFTKFHRGTDTLQYDFEGKGIGLFFTKLVIEEQGGKISVTSELNKGSEFKITLPVAS